MSGGLDFTELLKRAIKYLIEGLAVAFVALIVPRKPLNMEEIVIIALTAAASFSILDVFIPAMGASARGGAGFGLGANLVGGLRMVA
jgi:ABC-type Co2+ transport system permease subunit